MSELRSLILLLASTPLAWGSSRSSADYIFTADVLDSGGSRTGGGLYAINQSLGEIGGTIAAASEPYVARVGFTGQLYDRAGFSGNLAPQPLPEGEAGQLSAQGFNDDGTVFFLDPSSVSWSVSSGPIESVRPEGVVRASRVYADAVAIVGGTWEGFAADVEIVVGNVHHDDFFLYAGDGVPDAWQVAFFGENSEAGVGSADPDGDGQSNHFEYTAGLLPDDASSRFYFHFDEPTDIPGRATVRFGPIMAGRTYAVMWTLDFDSWAPLEPGSFVTHDQDSFRHLTDQSAPGRRLYRVNISVP